MHAAFCNRRPAASSAVVDPHGDTKRNMKPLESTSSKSKQSKDRISPRRAFPPELYRLIIEWVNDIRDLYNLALTSRICCAEAERILYRSVDVAQNTRAPVLWATSILNDARKAAAVRALTLRFDLSFLIVPDMLLPSLQLISQALRALRDLRTLVLVGHPLAMMHPIHSWFLDGCTAHLEVFNNSVLPPSAVINFLLRRPKIRQWTQAGICHDCTIEPAILPHLTTLNAHASVITSFMASRPIEQICLRIDGLSSGERERDVINALAPFASTLTRIRIDHVAGTWDALTPKEVMKLLAEATPRLKVLSYTCTAVVKPRAHPLPQRVDDLLTAVSRFWELEVLVLRLKAHGCQLFSGATPVPVDHRFLNEHPSLRRLIIKDPSGRYAYNRHRDGKVEEELDIRL